MAAKTWVDDPTTGTPITAADLNRIETDLASMQSQLYDIYNRRNRLLWSGSQSSNDTSEMQLDVPTDTEFDYGQILVCTSNNIVIPCGVDDDGRVNGVATAIVSGYELHLLSFWGDITKSGSSSFLSPNPSYMQFARLYTAMDGSTQGFKKDSYNITRIIGVA